MDLHIAKPITLPSGLTLPNRLSKAAMAEAMCPDGVPTPALNAAYEQWSQGGWGLVMTGNVQVDERYLGQAGDNVLLDDDSQMLAKWKPWAAACRNAAGGSPTVVQINHPGRQSPLGAGKRGFFTKSLAPSAVPLKLGSGLLARMMSALAFGTPKEMSVAEIEDVVRRFAATARISAEAGFDGVEIHAAHGYLLAQFLSPKTNLRTDAYGGNPVKRAKIVADVIKAVREATPKGFTVGIKLNSVDHQVEAELKDSIEQLRVIVDAGIDFLEISGGSYEDPAVSIHPPRCVQARAFCSFVFVRDSENVQLIQIPHNRCSKLRTTGRNQTAPKPARPSSWNSRGRSATNSPACR